MCTRLPREGLKTKKNRGILSEPAVGLRRDVELADSDPPTRFHRALTNADDAHALERSRLRIRHGVDIEVEMHRFHVYRFI